MVILVLKNKVYERGGSRLEFNLGGIDPTMVVGLRLHHDSNSVGTALLRDFDNRSRNRRTL